MKYRVIQKCETGEEFTQMEGTLNECHIWLEKNTQDYPESRFYIEPATKWALW